MAQAQHDTSQHVLWFEGGITEVLQNFKNLRKTFVVVKKTYMIVLKHKSAT